MNKLKALIRLLFFIVPYMVLSGVEQIFFERQEVVDFTIKLRKQWRPNLKQQALEDYLNKCFKIVHKEETNEKKRLDKD